MSPRAPAAVCAAAILAGCYSQSPLDPTPQVPLEPKLLGSWHCVSPEPEHPEAATAVFAAAPATGDREYLLTWQQPEQETESYRAFLSELGGSMFLNVRPTKEDQYTGWAFLRYSFLRDNVLYVEFVLDAPFKEKESSASPAAARATLGRALQANPEILTEYVVCMRAVTP